MLGSAHSCTPSSLAHRPFQTRAGLHLVVGSHCALAERALKVVMARHFDLLGKQVAPAFSIAGSAVVEKRAVLGKPRMIEVAPKVETDLIVVVFGAEILVEYFWERQAGIVWLVIGDVAADSIVAQLHSAPGERGYGLFEKGILLFPV